MNKLDHINAILEKLAISQAKTDVQLAKTDKKLDKVAKMLGAIGNNQGDVAEEFFYNTMKAKPMLNQIHYDFVDKNVTRSKHGIECEYDIIMVNGKDIAIIEVKYKAHQSDLDSLLNRKYQNFKKLYPEYSQFTHHLALASFKIDDAIKNEALKRGVMVLQRKGDVIETTLPDTNPPEPLPEKSCSTNQTHSLFPA